MGSTASNGAARQSPDEHRNEACRANARPCRSELARDGRQR